jgi:hypothetical protein
MPEQRMIEQQPLLNIQGRTRRSIGSSQGGSQQREATTATCAVLWCILCAALVATLVGCAGDTNPVRDAFVAAGVGAQRRKAPEFIEKSRPAAMEFAPVGIAQPKRGVAAKPKSGVAAAEAEMDAIRAKNEAKAKEARAVGATVGPVERPVARPE